MAANNVLLGAGKVYTESDVIQILNNFAPLWMFHKDHPEGQIVRDQSKFDKLVEEGWVDQPGKCALLPGHEHLYQGDEKVEVEEEEEVVFEPEPEFEFESGSEPSKAEPVKVDTVKKSAKTKTKIKPLF